MRRRQQLAMQHLRLLYLQQHSGWRRKRQWQMQRLTVPLFRGQVERSQPLDEMPGCRQAPIQALAFYRSKK